MGMVFYNNIHSDTIHYTLFMRLEWVDFRFHLYTK